ncbi:MAG: hypothetical protein JXA92_02590 [candidate division Zixibacteria bacterium]|nr:hypothetical protein [candidate division Zixibacteria bacterium]
MDFTRSPAPHRKADRSLGVNQIGVERLQRRSRGDRWNEFDEADEDICRSLLEDVRRPR